MDSVGGPLGTVLGTSSDGQSWGPLVDGPGGPPMDDSGCLLGDSTEGLLMDSAGDPLMDSTGESLGDSAGDPWGDSARVSSHTFPFLSGDNVRLCLYFI